MLTKVRSGLFGWLVALALWPLMSWGQEILVHPRNVTVCVGESAVFMTRAIGGKFHGELIISHWVSLC